MITPAHQEIRSALQRRDLGAAERLCAALLTKKRNDAPACVLMAEIKSAQSRFAEALQFMERAVRIDQKNVPLRVGFGRQLLGNGETKKALVQFEKAVKIDPASHDAVAGLATCHESLGRYDRAKKTLAPFVSKGNVTPPIAAVQLRVLLHDNAYEEAVALGAPVAAAGHPDSLLLRAMLFSLAKAQERTGAYEQALATATRANTMGAPPYDMAAARSEVERIISTFSAEALARIPRPARPSEVPVFIVGFPRCGSTLTEQIIHAHPAGFGAGEISDFRRTVLLPLQQKYQSPFPDVIRHITTDDAVALHDHYVESLGRYAPDAARITNKNLGNAMAVGLIAALFPGAKIIHTRRDALDTCLSCYLERLPPDQGAFKQSLESIGAHYRQYDRIMTHWKDELGLEILDVEYERLTADLETVTREILDFIGLPFDEACLAFHEASRVVATLSYDQVRRPIYRTSLGRADRYGALLDPLRVALGRAPFAGS